MKKSCHSVQLPMKTVKATGLLTRVTLPVSQVPAYLLARQPVNCPWQIGDADVDKPVIAEIT
jgi:hypothetical protein